MGFCSRSTRDHHTYKIIEERTERTIQKSFCDLEFDFTRGKSSNPADSVRRLIRDFRQKPIQTALESAAKIADRKFLMPIFVCFKCIDFSHFKRRMNEDLSNQTAYTNGKVAKIV